MKTNLNTTQLLATLVAIADKKELSAFISNNIGGLENRFTRQELMREISGVTVPLVKCGISHLVEAIDTFRNDPKNEMDLSLMGTPSTGVESVSEVIDEVTPTTEPTAEKLPAYQIEVGTPVIRKKCKRKGVIKANANGKMEIELEDGSIRKPASGRFYSLYNFANN